MSGAYAPFGTGVGGTPGRDAVTLGATPGSISAIASIEVRMPLPIAVRRPVSRLPSAASSVSTSVVGAWTSSAKLLNATIPIWVVEPWCWMKVAAAASAALSRLGGTSAEHMLPDTSIARMMLVWFVGTLAISTGRAAPSASAPTARTNSANGRCRRRRDDPGVASRRSDRLE